MAVSQAPSAVAGGWRCTGNQIDVYPVQTPSSEIWGYVHLFWDPNKTVSGEPGTTLPGFPGLVCGLG
jgi:hypothetical protein